MSHLDLPRKKIRLIIGQIHHVTRWCHRSGKYINTEFIHIFWKDLHKSSKCIPVFMIIMQILLVKSQEILIPNMFSADWLSTLRCYNGMIMKYLCCSRLLVIQINNKSILLPHIQKAEHVLYALKHQNTLSVNTCICQKECAKTKILWLPVWYEI